jgi:LPS sulfotransferase NodH
VKTDLEAAGRIPLTRPVFIVACGRSGTTILGQLLSQHPQIAYLNEPRSIWALEPRTDIWHEKARQNKAQLQFTASDVTPAALSIPAAFAERVREKGALRLVEKLPVNTFRVDFIDALFPGALFVHLVRNGIDVARSIGKAAKDGWWYTKNGYKWEVLVQYASHTGNGALVGLCTDNVSKGILEWKLSILAARDSLSRVAPERQLEIRYEQLIADPQTVCERLESFIGIPLDARMRLFATENIRQKIPHVAAPKNLLLIAGDLLAQLGYSFTEKEDDLKSDLAKLLDQLIQDVESVIPKGSLFILVNKGQSLKVTDRVSVPFPERAGNWIGYPANDTEAIEEFNRLRSAGAKFMVFPASMEYWLKTYPHLAQVLRTDARCVVSNEGGIIFDLRSSVAKSGRF